MPLTQTHPASKVSDRQRSQRFSKPPPIAYISMFLAGLLVAATVKSMHDLVIEWNQREILRRSSPDGSVEAVFVQPIVSYLGWPALFIIPKDGVVPAWGAVVRMSQTSEVPTLAWRNPQLLEMRFSRGCIEAFTNLWHSNEVSGGHFYVEVRLVPTSQFTCLKSAASAASSTQNLGSIVTAHASAG
jgi:hypothetical protein